MYSDVEKMNRLLFGHSIKINSLYIRCVLTQVHLSFRVVNSIQALLGKQYSLLDQHRDSTVMDEIPISVLHLYHDNTVTDLN